MRARRGGARSALVALALGLGLGCASLAPDPLLRLRPVVWAGHGEVRLVRCRWPDGARVGVRVPDDAEPLAAAVRAWDGAGLPIRLELRAPGEPAEIAIRLVERLDTDDGRGRKGEARADCLRSDDGSFALERAEVRVARLRRDALGRLTENGPEELAGAAIHELGHALGFAGHVPSAGSEPLDAAAEVGLRLGRRALRGQPVHSRAIAALYARPNGTVVAHRQVEAWRTRQLDAFARFARAGGHAGPYLRAGDSGARIFWRMGGGEVGFGLATPEATLRDPAEALFVPDATARAILSRLREEQGAAGVRGGGSRPPGRAPAP